jgi:hypothetical protein
MAPLDAVPSLRSSRDGRIGQTRQPHDLRTARDRPAAGAAPLRRWRLNRAGIINVYQYGNETLHFGGGRSGRWPARNTIPSSFD